MNSKLRDKYDNDLILAALIVDHSDNYEYFCYKYKISNEIKDRFKNISENFENLRNKKFYLKENIKKLNTNEKGECKCIQCGKIFIYKETDVNMCKKCVREMF